MLSYRILAYAYYKYHERRVSQKKTPILEYVHETVISMFLQPTRATAWPPPVQGPPVAQQRVRNASPDSSRKPLGVVPVSLIYCSYT